jgi:hypothetical protein
MSRKQSQSSESPGTPEYSFSKIEKELVAEACNALANWIETDQIHLSATDAQQTNTKFNALSPDQMKKILALRQLAMKMDSSGPHFTYD